MTTSPFFDGLIDEPEHSGLNFRADSHLVGSVYEISYQRAVVAIYDHDREAAGGLPMGGFLVSAKQDGDKNFILLRILKEARLPNAQDSSQTRQHAIEAAANEQAWAQQLDDWTRNRLSIHGVECRVLGTFVQESDGAYRYAEDVDNYYAVNQLMVWKPGAATLSVIVNHRHKSNPIPSTKSPPTVGSTRFAASEQESATTADVALYPEDMLRRRTVYLGMSRSGKSNAMKVAAEAIYRIREHEPDRRIGQLIFDPNGEYAQDTRQDGAGLHRIHETIGLPRSEEVETYGLFAPPSDRERKITKINFFGDLFSRRYTREDAESALEQLFVGRDSIRNLLAGETARYISAFRDADLSIPDDPDEGQQLRYHRAVLAYRTALAAAGLPAPYDPPPVTAWFGQDFLKAMKSAEDFKEYAKLIENHAPNPTWPVLETFFTELNKFLSSTEYGRFNTRYMGKHDGREWADPQLRNILRIFETQNGPRSFQRVRDEHDPRTENDYAESIVNDLRKGKLVIFDQSTGDPEQNKAVAERIMWKVFNRQQAAFRSAVSGGPSDGREHHILVYLEEAHNLLPRANAADNLTSVWARSAKEGSKLDIGMVLATQAPSSIMPEILNETDNWILAHLNSKRERNVLGDYEDFGDFLDQIGQVSEPGFVRVRSLSLAYTVPMQFKRFHLDLEPYSAVGDERE